MLLLSSAFAAFSVANGMLTRQENECYDFWNKLEEAGVGEFDELAVNVGVNINAGAATVAGTGMGMNFGQAHLIHTSENGDFGAGVPEHAQDLDNAMVTGVGGNVNLGGAQMTAVQSGVGITQQGALSNVDLYRGSMQNLHIPGFAQMNGGLAGNGMTPNSNVRRYGEGLGVGYTNYGVGRRLMENACGPPPAAGGKPVTCASTGDPHINDFQGRKFDLMSFGEFIFYNSWEPFSHHPQTNLKIQVRTGPFNGNQRVATNHGIAIGGRLACGNKYEIYKEGKNVYSRLKIRRRNGAVVTAKGKAQIYAQLQKENCPTVAIEGDVAHFVFEQDENEDRTTLRVQIVSYGLNLGLDVLGSLARPDTDRGVCTKNAGWDMQLECSHSMFTEYPTGSCQTLQRTGHAGGPPQKCPTALFNAATARCSQCPETVHPKGCVYDVCAAGSISAVDEILAACRVGARLPKRMSANVGVNMNMAGATAIAAGRGVGINYGTSNVRVIDG